MRAEARKAIIVLASYLASDMVAALDCYGQGMRHSRGTQLFDLDLAYPINGSTNPKAIPGAIVRYNFQVQNSGPAAVDSNAELVDMIETARMYQNNVQVLNTAKSLMLETIRIGK